MKNEINKINISLLKSGLAMCWVCGEIKERSEMKYIHRGLSLFWIPACQKCREHYTNNKLLKYFVKVEE